MKIALISLHSCPLGILGSLGVGGMNTYILNLSRVLSETRNETYIFTRSHGDCCFNINTLGNGVKLIHIPIGSIEDSKDDLFQLTDGFATEILNYININNLKLDIIHSHYWLSGKVSVEVSEAIDVPFVTTFHTLAKTKSRATSIVNEHIEREQTEQSIMDKSAGILVLSEIELTDIDFLYDVNRDKITVISPGLDTNMFSPVPKNEARKYVNSKTENMILYVGRIDSIKGIDLLLDVIEIIGNDCDITLYIVGGGEIKSNELIELDQDIKNRNIGHRVVLTGSIPQQELKLYYSAADLFILPSYYESLGFVVLESMACATPVVAANVGGIPSLITHMETGILLDHRSSESFSEAIKYLLNNDDIRKNMGKQGYISNKDRSWVEVAQKMELFYMNSINKYYQRVVS